MEVKMKTQPIQYKLQKQNYAPFITKSPRFQSNNSKHQLQTQAKPNKKEMLLKENIIHNSRISQSSSNMTKSLIKQDYIFKSKISRFTNEPIINTPSPGQYDILTEKRIKTSQHLNSKLQIVKKMACKSPTLPTIPDKRNKFGITFQVQAKYIQKSDKQITRQKELMRHYQQTLSQQKYYKEKVSSPEIHVYKIQSRVKQFLKDEQTKQKHHRPIIQKAKGDKKIRVQHLYEFHPKRQKQNTRKYLIEQTKSQARKKLTRYQFFNSSEKRFKQMPKFDQDRKDNPTIRQYLQKLVTLKTNMPSL